MLGICKKVKSGVPMEMNQDNMSKSLAFTILAIIIVVVISAGQFIGNQFFWNKPVYESKADFDLEIALNRVNNNPQIVEFRIELGWAFIQKGDYEAAITEYRNAVKLNENHLGAKYNLALGLLQVGSEEAETEAEHLLEELLENSPTFIEARLTLGEYYLEQQHFEKAIEQFQFALNANPGTVDYMYLIGQAKEGKGDVEGARQFYEQAISYVPDFRPALDALQKNGQKVGN